VGRSSRTAQDVHVLPNPNLRFIPPQKARPSPSHGIIRNRRSRSRPFRPQLPEKTQPTGAHKIIMRLASPAFVRARQLCCIVK
jgi:hypothetical protein